MSSPLMVIRVRVDRQGRLVLPKRIRQELGADPGELALRRTADGVLLTRLAPPGQVGTADDDLPTLALGRPVTNDEVLDAIDTERASR